jgi:hypothetical protein
MRDDRLHWLFYPSFGPLAVFKAVYGPILWIFPADTSVYWSWQIRPEMSTIVVGAGYIFGALSITTMLILRRASRAVAPLLATFPFAVIMLLATLLHLDRFFLGTITFGIWFIIYLALPFVLPALWWLNRRHDPGVQPGDLLTPPLVRWIGLAAGIGFGLLALVMIVSPEAAAGFWPWQLTPLMSRVIGGWVLFAAAAALTLFVERRYGAFRPYTLTLAVWFGALLLGSLRFAGQFDSTRPATLVWYVVVSGVIVLTLLFGLWEERQLRGRRLAVDPGSAGLSVVMPQNET